MGGQMSVISEIDKGSTFSFQLSLPIDEKSLTNGFTSTDAIGARVMVVEESVRSRDILVEKLRYWQFESAGASSGQEALAALDAMYSANLVPDCIIIEYQMQGMDGAELATALRNDTRFQSLPIVMLTSVDIMDDGRNFSSLGIDGQLIKPIRSSALLDTVMQIVNHSQLIDCDIKSGVNLAKSMKDVCTEPGELESQKVTPVEPKADKLEEAIIQQKADSEAVVEIEVPVQAKVDNEPKYELLMNSSNDNQNGGIDVLVAEDNEVNQLVICQILEAAGYSYEVANNGEEAVNLYHKHTPKIICMDVSMPVMNGHEATRVIRDMEADTGGHTPIIGVTAHAIKGDMEACFEAGMDDYASKPVSPEVLEKKIESWLNGSAQSRRIA
jgi:CheY-like chemotaxis protein